MRSNYAIIQSHYAASDRRDLPGMLADVADKVEWTEMAGFPCAGTWVGRQAVIEHVFTALARDWNDYHFLLDRLVDGGAVVVAIGSYRATHRASGKALHARVAHVWQLEGGLVVRFEQFCDTLLVAQAMA
jgi:ketosteroid isomerase-like protein